MILEPGSSDLENWRLLEENPELGFFIQTSRFPAELSPDRKDALTRLLQEMSDRHPEFLRAGDPVEPRELSP